MADVQKPGWVTGVAIIAIVLSGFGLMGGIQEAISPLMFEQQKAQYEEMISEFDEIIAELEQTDDPTAKNMLGFFKVFTDSFEKIINMPDWYKNWMVISGILQLVINGLYIFAAIWLLQLKPYSVQLLIIALPLSIALGMTRVYLAHAAFDTTGLWVMSGSMMAIVIEIVLLLILVKANKAPFRQFEA